LAVDVARFGSDRSFILRRQGNRVKAISPKLLNRIVFIAGDTVNQATNSFLSSVPNPVLSKPFDFRELEQFIVSLIGQEPIMSDNETAVI
jgi:hypothetical protein